MPKFAIFTVCSLNHLGYARTLAESLKAAYGDVNFHIFLADRNDHSIIDSLSGLDVIAVESMNIPNILDMAFKYSILEFNCALKPYCFEFLFESMGYDHVIYLDSDIYVLRPLEHVAAALEDGNACVLTPHISAPLVDGKRPSDYEILRAGVYNLGFAAFKNEPSARRFIAWWKDKLAEDCYHEVERGVHADQRFCDLAPAFIEKTLILHHPGYNLAYWNFPQRPVVRTGSGYTAAGLPLYFAHFSGIEPDNPDSVSKYQNRFRRRDLDDVGLLYDFYLERVRANDIQAGGKYSLPSYGFDRMNDGRAITVEMRKLYRQSRDSLPPRTNPFALPEIFFSSGKTEAAAQPKWFLPSLAERLFGRIGLRAASAANRKALQKGVNVIGFAAAELGIGEAFRMTARSLLTTDEKSTVINFTVGVSSRNQDISIVNLIGSENNYYVNLFHVNVDQIGFALNHFGRGFFRGHYNIGYCVWELSVCPTYWRKTVKPMNEIWTFSNFTADSFRKVMRVPVTMMSLAISTKGHETYLKFKKEDYGLAPDQFCFLFVFDSFSYLDRKNPVASIRAFKTAFREREDIRLIIKTQNASKTDPKWIRVLEEVGDDKRIKVINETFSRAKILGLINVADAFLSLHRSEGFGIGIAEAMLLGKPVICTAYSGNMDFTRPDNACLVDYRLIPVERGQYPYWEPGQEWADPDIDHAARYMRQVADDAQFRAQIGSAAQTHIESNYNLEVIGRRYADRISTIYSIR